MCKFILVIFLCALPINSLMGNLSINRARVLEHIPYFSNVIQEFVYKLEQREWCNLKMIDINSDVSFVVANWNVTGTLLYTNGFVKSIQKIDVHNIEQSVRNHTVNNITRPVARVNGRLMFHDVNIGYDIHANLADIGVQRYTGEFLATSINLQFIIDKDMVTQELTGSALFASVTSTHSRVIYRPDNNVTEVLSRDVTSIRNGVSASVRSWLPNFNSILTPILIKVGYPKVCFNRNC